MENLFTVNPMLLHLEDFWTSRLTSSIRASWPNNHDPIYDLLNVRFLFSFSSLRFVRLDSLLSADLPLLPAEFEELVQRQCQNTKDELLNT